MSDRKQPDNRLKLTFNFYRVISVEHIIQLANERLEEFLVQPIRELFYVDIEIWDRDHDKNGGFDGRVTFTEAEV